MAFPPIAPSTTSSVQTQLSALDILLCPSIHTPLPDEGNTFIGTFIQVGICCHAVLKGTE